MNAIAPDVSLAGEHVSYGLYEHDSRKTPTGNHEFDFGAHFLGSLAIRASRLTGRVFRLSTFDDTAPGLYICASSDTA